MSGEQVALPFDGRYMLFDVDMLRTAMLVLMDAPGDFPENLQHCASVLRDEHGFNKQDFILYPRGSSYRPGSWNLDGLVLDFARPQPIGYV